MLSTVASPATEIPGNALQPTTNNYDSAGSLGFLSQSCNANNECQTFTYDPRGSKSGTTFNAASSSTQAFTYDEDGRPATFSNGVGTVSDAYDADGRKTSRAEQVGAIGATITYSYYADGLRKALDISGGSQSLPQILAYTYRSDGPVRRVAVAGSQSFSFSYTGGRRLTSRSDSSGQPANMLTYNGVGSPTSYGLVQSVSAPAFNESGITYNAEGGQLSESSFNSFNGSGWFPTAPVNNTYTSRRELAASYRQQLGFFANGTRIPSPIGSFSFNVFQGMTAATLSADGASAWTYGYDAVGREISASFAGESGMDHVNTKTYDAENHLTSQGLPWIAYGKSGGGMQQQLGYKWGAFGHPLQIGSTSLASASGPVPTDFQYDTLGWDDDTLLFTVTPSGQIDDVKIGNFADYVPGATNPLTIWDRDPNGQIFGCHTGNGAASAAASAFQTTTATCGGSYTSSSFTGAIITSNATSRTVGRGGMLLMPKSDGFNDGQNTFQGVRSYDPQAGTWTTPDAYHGDVRDPVSQKPYIWNRNNPYAYSDPSGYDAIVQVTGNHVNITLPVTFIGGTAAERAMVVETITKFWSGNFEGYIVKTEVTEGNMNTITIDNNGGTNVTVESGTMNHMHLNLSDKNIGYGIKHETGHLLGLKDEYHKIEDEKGNMIGSTPWGGSENNLMGVNGKYGVQGWEIEEIINAPQNTVKDR